MTTAEWRCSKCGATNRKLVPAHMNEVKDRCVTCRTWHVVHRGERPTFWKATARP